MMSKRYGDHAHPGAADQQRRGEVPLRDPRAGPLEDPVQGEHAAAHQQQAEVQDAAAELLHPYPAEGRAEERAQRPGRGGEAGVQRRVAQADLQEEAEGEDRAAHRGGEGDGEDHPGDVRPLGEDARLDQRCTPRALAQHLVTGEAGQDR
jgi:hypothetical protein